MGLNVRIYKMSEGAMDANNYNSNIDKENFDVWREIKYYEFVREHILKNKISPNFVSIYLYKMDPDTNIDYDKINGIILQNFTQFDQISHTENNNLINKLHTFNDLKGFGNTLVGIKGKSYKSPQNKSDLTKYSNKSLFALTEAPTHNIIQWASPIYDKHGSVKRMVSTGYHTPEVWKSILFQLVYAFSVLQENNIYFKNTNLVNNVFIKDIYYNQGNVGYWIYKIDDMEYFATKLWIYITY